MLFCLFVLLKIDKGLFPYSLDLLAKIGKFSYLLDFHHPINCWGTSVGNISISCNISQYPLGILGIYIRQNVLFKTTKAISNEGPRRETNKNSPDFMSTAQLLLNELK